MAPKSKTEIDVVDARTGEIADPAMMAEMMADIEAGLTEKFGTDDLIIPRITILQDLSPQVKERKSEYVPGAKPGLIYNSVNNALEESIIFVPAKFHTSWVAWRPRPEGGLINNNVDRKILTEENGFMKDGIDQYVGHLPDHKGEMVKVEVIKTPEWVGVARGSNGWTMPVAIAFPKTAAKAARRINSMINQTEVTLNGKVQTPPPFYNTFTLSTAEEQSGENEWYGWAIAHDGWANTDPRMLTKARDIRTSLEDGTASVADQEEV